jgi:ubiquinone/menaquinone biosynthesis C-methylase UbiE
MAKKFEKRELKQREALTATGSGFMRSLPLLVANRVGIFALLAHKRKSLSQIVRALHTDREATLLMLNALAGQGYLRKSSHGYMLTPLYRKFLAPDGKLYVGDTLQHHYNLLFRWIRLEDILRRGRKKVLGTHSVERAKWQVEHFIRAMENTSRVSSQQVLSKISLAPYRFMLDLGGGPGTAAIMFARRYPNLRAVVFDRPDPLRIARREIARHKLAHRIRTLAGDFLEDPIGSGYDLIYISNVIHSMSKDEIGRVLVKVRRALVPGGTVMIKDFLLDRDFVHPPFASLFAINMLINTPGGRSYGYDEIRALVKRLGFGRFRCVRLTDHTRILIARMPHKSRPRKTKRRGASS